jgi:hypothetical protein
VGEHAHILIDVRRSHVGVTVTKVEPRKPGWVWISTEEYPDERFPVCEEFVMEIGDRYKGKLLPKR